MFHRVKLIIDRIERCSVIEARSLPCFPLKLTICDKKRIGGCYSFDIFLLQVFVEVNTRF